MLSSFISPKRYFNFTRILICKFNGRNKSKYDDFFDVKSSIDWASSHKSPRTTPSLTISESVRSLSPQYIKSYLQKHSIELEGEQNPILGEKLTDFSFNDQIDSKLKNQKITVSTPIQAVSLPITMRGDNLVGIAQTGSGKTLSYLLPAIRLIQETRKTNTKTGFVALVIAPTREIAMQIHRVASSILPQGMTASIAYGGVNRQRQLDKMSSARSDLLIATPGRLFDFVSSSDISLNSVEMLVMDEADHMLQMGFYQQIKGILHFIRPDRQVMMWSATWPREIRSLAKEVFGRDYVMLTIGGRELTCNPDITQMFESYQSYNDKITKLLQFLSTDQANVLRILIFCETKICCDRLSYQLCKNKFKAAALHGDKSQDYRQSIIESFSKVKTGEPTKIVVASNVAARGLDIEGGVDIVINFDFPKQFEFYVHRIGRTGRAGRKGLSLSFVGYEEQPVAGRIIELLQHAGQEVSDVISGLSNKSHDHSEERRPSYSGNRRRSPRWENERFW